MDTSIHLAGLRRIIVHQLQQKYPKEIAETYSWWLLCWALGLSHTQILAHPHKHTSAVHLNRLTNALERILNQDEPIAYILGTVPFLNLTLTVLPPILIPRSETEAWCAQIIDAWRLEHKAPQRILDIGTGSGCLLLALASTFPQSYALGIDQSAQACALAEENRKKLGIHHAAIAHVRWPDLDLTRGPFDLIVSNPPYISPNDEAALPRSVSAWEDRDALIAADDGFACIAAILNNAQKYLRITHISQTLPALAIEIDASHGSRALAYAHAAGWRNGILIQDIHGRNRVLTVTHHCSHERIDHA